MASGVHRMKVLSLYKQMLRESQKFSSYNYRMYALRRIRDAFRDNKCLTDSTQIRSEMEYANKNLDIIKRQGRGYAGLHETTNQPRNIERNCASAEILPVGALEIINNSSEVLPTSNQSEREQRSELLNIHEEERSSSGSSLLDISAETEDQDSDVSCRHSSAEDDENEDEEFQDHDNILHNDSPESTHINFQGTVTFKDGLMKNDILSMMLSVFVKHKLTHAALSDILMLLNTLCVENCFPTRFDSFFNFFGDSYNCKRAYICKECKFYFRTDLKDLKEPCQNELCLSTNKSFFIVIPVENQIKETFKKYKTEIAEYDHQLRSTDIADIHKGQIFKELGFEADRPIITISCNTDGASRMKSTTKKPMYGLLMTLNNLPPKYRYDKRNMLMSAVWMGDGEPDMSAFFYDFCVEMNSLYRTGINIDGTLYAVRVVMCCLDLIAKSKVQNITQCTGYYGCGNCLQSGIWSDEARQVRFLYEDVILRENDVTRMEMSIAEESNEPVYGIKGYSVLASLPGFNVVRGFPVDYLHCCLLGVVKTITVDIWFNSRNFREDYYIGSKKFEINRRLTAIRPHSEVQRYPRSLEELKQYKANEFQMWLLYYSIPCLSGHLPVKYLDHFKLLADSIHLLMDPKLTNEMIQQASHQLEKFVQNFQVLYGVKYMVPNVHLLRHLGRTATDFGPLQFTSLFYYEHLNGMLLDWIKGPTTPVLQIMKKIILSRTLFFKTAPHNLIVTEYIRQMFETKKNMYLQYKGSLATHLQEGVDVEDEHQRRRLYTSHLKIKNKQGSFCTRNHCKSYLYDDSYVMIDNTFIVIDQILVNSQNIIFVVGSILNVYPVMKNVYSYVECNRKKLFLFKNVKKCIGFKVNNEFGSLSYVCILKMNIVIE